MENGSAAPSEARNSAQPEVDHTSTPAQSHPMTTSTSTSSHLSNKDSPPPKTGYGTRSRNRPGAPRPNYAEDVEMDFEMAPQANGRDHSSMDLSSNSPPAIELRQSPTLPSKRGNQTSNGWNALNNNSSSIPGMSHFPANPNARVPHSRKRKAAEASAGQSQSPAPATQTLTRRSQANAAQIHPPVRESNMLSFEKYRAILKHGKLVADDGSSFSVNGTYKILLSFPTPFPLSDSFQITFISFANRQVILTILDESWNSVTKRPMTQQRPSKLYVSTGSTDLAMCYASAMTLDSFMLQCTLTFAP